MSEKKRQKVNKMSRTSGITLIALVVTIVVLLILAGITIQLVLTDGGIFSQAQNAKIQTELGKIEERANLIYADKLVQNVPISLNNKPTLQDIVEPLRTEGYQIEKMKASGDAITGISLSRESMILGFGNSNTIKVTLETNGEPYIYYAIVNGKYYQMHYNNGNITIDRTSSEITDIGKNPTLIVSSSDETIATATLDNDTNVVNVTSNNASKAGTITITITCGSYTKTCSVTVKEVPISTALEMNSVRARIAAGYTRWLGAMTTPTDTLQEFEWSSSDESIATVNNNGVVTAKKAGKAIVTAKTIDGSNKEGTCEVTVVENAVDVAKLTDFQTKNTVAKDANGNLITVPGDFKILTDLGTKVTDGIVIQDREGNEFVWVPIDSVSTGTEKVADDIRLGRYSDFSKTNASGNYTPIQDALNYSSSVPLGIAEYCHCIETVGGSGYHTPAKSLENFVTKSFENGGYYFARYEAGRADNDVIVSKANVPVWRNVSQGEAASYARNMYDSAYIDSDLANSYSWDTAIIFIQKFSSDSAYSQKTIGVSNILNSGELGDELLNINDMSSNCIEWTTEHGIYSQNHDLTPCMPRGRSCQWKRGSTSSRWNLYRSNFQTGWCSFRAICYIKD